MDEEKKVSDNGTETEAVGTVTDASAQQEPLPAKTYTEDEVNRIVGKKKAQERARLEKQYEREYGELLGVLRAGTGKETVGDLTDTYRQHYEGRGIKIQSPAQKYSAKDLETLARADAQEFIDGGYEDVVEEMNRLEEIGVDKMTPREKATFRALAESRKASERTRELSQLGAGEDVLQSKEFLEFASEFNENTPMSRIYEHYKKLHPKQEVATMGSMANSNPFSTSGVKEFYTPEEARRFTQEEINNNPELERAILRSMKKWNK